jgi:transposase
VETRPLAPEIWEKLPPEVQAYILFLENALRQALERIAQLEQQVNELEARLNRHSGNSSQPPSQDPPQAPKNRREKSGRNPGGQPGHQGNHRELAPPEKVNKVVEHRAEACPHCRRALQPAATRQAPPLERHQVWELPEIRPVITEHRLLPGWCGHCRAPGDYQFKRKNIINKDS